MAGIHNPLRHRRWTRSSGKLNGAVMGTSARILLNPTPTLIHSCHRLSKSSEFVDLRSLLLYLPRNFHCMCKSAPRHTHLLKGGFIIKLPLSIVRTAFPNSAGKNSLHPLSLLPNSASFSWMDGPEWISLASKFRLTSIAQAFFI